MNAYRCYRTIGSGQIIGVELFELLTDLEACTRARVVALEGRWDGFQLWKAGNQIFCDGL
jgi:hypothetical protein